MPFARPAAFAAILTASLATGAAACPWAGSSYSAVVPPDIKLKVTFDASCGKVRLVDSGGKARNLATKASNKGWTIKYDSTTITFDTKGKRAQGQRGGARRSLRLKKL